MLLTEVSQREELSQRVIQAFERINGSHPGFRPAHAKGILLSGIFTPSAAGADLTRAPHLHRPSTPVTVRFSNFAGMPNIPDTDPDASPRGMAIRFHLAEHVHTDITAHSVNGFPSRTAEEFVEFLTAAADGGAAIGGYLAAHPAALAFVQAPKPLPRSFATESYFAVSAYGFLDASNALRHGRYRIVPEGGNEFLAPDAPGLSPNYLIEEIKERLAQGPAKMRILLQLASGDDVVNDSTIQWPTDRTQVEFGTLELTSVVPTDGDPQRRIIFDPIPRIDGIETSGDPLLEPRADAYLMSGRRRRQPTGTV